MKLSILTAAVVFFFTHASLSMADPPADRSAALEAKLIGKWKGDGPCVGGLLFRADRTYEQTHHGPGDDNNAGTWMVRWDGLPPTLVLTCKTSNEPTNVGEHLKSLHKLNDQTLEIGHPASTTEATYFRQKP